MLFVHTFLFRYNYIQRAVAMVTGYHHGLPPTLKHGVHTWSSALTLTLPATSH